MANSQQYFGKSMKSWGKFAWKHAVYLREQFWFET